MYMPQHEFPTITFECFPHGRPREYLQPGLVDMMLAAQSPGIVVAPPSPRIPPPPPVKPVEKPARPSVEVAQPFRDAVVDEIERSGEAVTITKFVTGYARKALPKALWRDFEKLKIDLLKQVEQFIRDGVLERIARRHVTIPRRIHPDKLHYFR